MDDRGNRGSQRCTRAEQVQLHRRWCLPLCTAESGDIRSCGPIGFALLYVYEIAEYAAGIGSVSKKIFLENAMQDLSITL